MPGVLQHHPITFHTMPERSFALFKVSREIRSLSNMSRSLQYREMFISRAGDNKKYLIDDNHHLFRHDFRFTPHFSRHLISKTVHKERFVNESSAPKHGRMKSRKMNRLSHHINHIRIRKSFWQKLWAKRRQWRA